MQIIQDTVAGLEFGAPVVHRQMAMFPLLNRKSDAGSRTYLTLDEALKSATARVGEVSDGGSVPELLFKNLGDKPVLLVEGEELVGAKQNRTLNVSILAPPGRETRIPVTCVEAGRWGYGDGVEFQRSDRAHYARGRRTKREAVNRNMSHDPGSRAADQGAVWEDIDAKMATMSARSDTGAMSDIYEQNRGSLDDYVVAFGQQPGQVGAVFMVGTTFAGVDLFAHEATFAGLLPKLARSYALDAMELDAKTPFKPPKASAQGLVADVVAAQARAYPAVGEGQDVRIESRTVAGGALVEGDAVLHMAAFRRDAERAVPLSRAAIAAPASAARTACGGSDVRIVRSRRFPAAVREQPAGSRPGRGRWPCPRGRG